MSLKAFHYHKSISPSPSDLALSRSTRQSESDLSGAFSGYGSYCPEGIPVEQAIFAILAAFAASFGVLFRAITMITQGRRRKKRSQNDHEDGLTLVEVLQNRAADLYWWGTFIFINYYF